MNDLISRQVTIASIEEYAYRHTYLDQIIDIIKELPPAQPTLYGYSIEHLEVIARILQKEDLPPEKVAEAITNIDRIVTIVIDEFKEKFEESLLSKLNM